MQRERELDLLQINFRNVLAEYELCIVCARDEGETKKKGTLSQTLYLLYACLARYFL